MRPAGGRFRFDTALDPWMAMKAQFRAATGISFSGSLGCQYQNYSDPLNGVQDAEGFKLTFNLSKDIINAGTPDAMTPDIAVEQRGPVGTPLPPLQGGIAAGNMVPTAATRGGSSIWGSASFTSVKACMETGSNPPSARYLRRTMSMPIRSSMTTASS